MESERAFAKAMTDIYHAAKREGYTPTYFIQMISELGPLATAKRLIGSDVPSDGFTRLYELGRLDLTVEAVCLDPQWSDLFTAEERRQARTRLAAYGWGPTTR